MLRFSEIRPLFVDLSLSDKSFSFFVRLWGWSSMENNNTHGNGHGCSLFTLAAILTARSSRLHTAIRQCISVHRVSQVHVSPLYGDGREGALYEMEKKPFVRCGGDAVALSERTPTR